METREYEGGIGGKFRKRPFRRAASTPYDRPPSSLRGSRAGNPPLGAAAAGSSGWLSKLVDPASRLIATGASRLFSSVFRKRLEAPPQAPEENHKSKQVLEGACAVDSSKIPSSELQKEDREKYNATNSSNTDGIAELEQLLKQKTFTRVEFDQLAELLRSRTVEPTKIEEVNIENKEKASFSAKENGIESSNLHGGPSVPAGSLTIPREEASSPAELAKAYMGSSSAVGLRSQVSWGDANLPSMPSASKPLDLSVAPRSTIRFSGVPDHSENGYQTPIPRGRSAMYRMSRSPYFKVNPTANIKGGKLTRDGYTSLSSSDWTPRSAMQSGGKQAFKRGSSVLDSDLGSVGPIRRIRHKSNLVSPSKDTRLSLSGNLLPSPSTPIEGSASIQKSIALHESKYGNTGFTSAGDRENKTSNSNAARHTFRSSETAQKLFQQLDKLLPSQKEKSSELKATSRDESPSKLTLDMLQGRALRSMENIDSSKFFNVQGSGKLDTASGYHLPSLKDSLSQNVDRVEENGPLKSDVIGVKLTSEADGMNSAVVHGTDAKPGMRSVKFAASGSSVFPPARKPAFKISAPEDSPELDNDDNSMTDNSCPLTIGKNAVESRKGKYKNVISETADSEKPLKLTSESMSVSSSISYVEAKKKDSVQPVSTERDNGFSFPLAAAPCTNSQPPPTPTMPHPVLDRSVGQKEQTAVPVFSFGSKVANTCMFSSAATDVTEAAAIEADGGSGSKRKLFNSNTTTISLEGSNLDNGVETKKSGDIFKSFGNAVSSGISTSTIPTVSAFGAASTASAILSNGTLRSSSPSFSVSGTPAATHSEASASSNFTSNTAVTSKLNGPLISSAAPVFSTVPSFQFGSSTSAVAPVSVSLPLDKSNSSGLETKPVKALSFGVSSSVAQNVPAVPPSMGSSSSLAAVTSTAFFGTGDASSALQAPSIISSTPSSSSAAATTLFSSMGGSSSFPSSSAFPSTGSSIFGASAQSASSSLSFANNSSQNSVTSTTFGAAGSMFGTQPTQSGSEMSKISQSSTSQFGSFSPSPSFGLGNSSSSGFGISPFGAAASGAKPFSSSSGVSFSAVAGSSSTSTSSSFSPAATTGLFGSSSHPPASSLFGSSISSSTSPSSGFTFGLSASGSGSSPFAFGSSSGSVFPFSSTGTTAASTTSSPVQPVFGAPNPAAGFSSGSPGNDQMNVEDSMADDTNQAAAPIVPTFGQPANSPAQPSFMFGSPAVQPSGPSVFQFGSHQSSAVPQNPSPFQAAGNLEFPPGGSFSLGSGGGDKSGRKIVKIRRDKLRKK